MKHFAWLPFLFLAASVSPTYATSAEPSEVSSASVDLDRAESELNRAFRELTAKLNQPGPGMSEHHAQAKKSLVRAQRAWLTFRDRDCDAVFDMADGTSKAALSTSCLAERDLQRAKELRDMANGL